MSQNSYKLANSWVNAEQQIKECHGALAEAPDPHGMVPTSTWYKCKVFENIHMLCVGRKIRRHTTSTILVDLEFRELAKLMHHRRATNNVMAHSLRHQTHTWNGSHSLCKPYKVFDTIHILWMGRWIHHHSTCTIYAGPEFMDFGKFLGHRWATNNIMAHWLRPQTHMEWFPHSLETYTRYLRTFICCGGADGSTAMLRTPYMLALN